MLQLPDAAQAAATAIQLQRTWRAGSSSEPTSTANMDMDVPAPSMLEGRSSEHPIRLPFVSERTFQYLIDSCNGRTVPGRSVNPFCR